MLEVRVLWGGDVLRVHHLAPPRSFSIGDAGSDLAVDVDALGIERCPLVRVEGGGVFAVAPAGAEVMTRRADAPGNAALAEEGERIRLAPGMEVTLALPSRRSASAYRSPPAGADAAGISLEIALVPAERVAWRARSIDGAGRLLVGAAVALAILAGVRTLAWFSEPACGDCDPDEPTMDQVYAIQQALMAVAEKELALEPPEHEPPPDAHIAGTVAVEDAIRFGLISDPSRYRPPIGNLRPLALTGGFRLTGDPFVDFFGGPIERSSALATSGIRLDRTAFEDPFGLGPDEIWGIGYEALLRSRSLALPRPQSVVTIATRGAPRWISTARFERALRTRHAALRDCYEPGLIFDPRLAGSVDFDVVIEGDGFVTARRFDPDAYRQPSAAARGDVVRCMAGVLDGLRIPSPEGRLDTVRVTIGFRPVAGKPR
jgi:hypothetical protein